MVAPLDELFPERGLRPGAVVALGGTSGSISLLLGLLAGPLAAGSWGAVVGIPELGVEAAANLGINLEHLALLPRSAPGASARLARSAGLVGPTSPGSAGPAALARVAGPAGLAHVARATGPAWPEVVAILLGGLDVVALRPPGRCRPGEARRLAARAREARSVLLLLAPAQAWPEPVDIELVVTAAVWQGLEAGHGTLAYRTMEVRSSGRRAASRERRVRLCLPGPGGLLEVASGVADVADVSRGHQTGESSLPLRYANFPSLVAG